MNDTGSYSLDEDFCFGGDFKIHIHKIQPDLTNYQPEILCSAEGNYNHFYKISAHYL